MQKTIVLINGEKQVGKSTYARHLTHLLENNGGIPARTYSFVRPIEGALRGLVDSIYGDGYAASFTYEELKTMTIGGVSGRDWLIEIGNGARRLSHSQLPKMFFAYIAQHTAIDVWVIENWGFPDEEAAIRAGAAKHDYRVITVALTYRATRKYACGEQYDGDNRFNLDCITDFVNIRVNDLANKIDENTRLNHENRYPFDSVARAFGQPDVIVPLHEAINQLDYAEDGQWESDDMPSITYLHMVTGLTNLTVSAVMEAMAGRRRSDYVPGGLEVTTQLGTLEEPATTISAAKISSKQS